MIFRPWSKLYKHGRCSWARFSTGDLEKLHHRGQSGDGTNWKYYEIIISSLKRDGQNLWKPLNMKHGKCPFCYPKLVKSPYDEWLILQSKLLVGNERHNLRTLFYSTAMGRENGYIAQHVFLYKWKFTKQNLNYEISDLCQESLVPVLPIMVLSITGVRKRTGPRPRWVWGEQLRSQMPTLKLRNRWCEEIGDSGVVWKNQRIVFLQVDIHMGCLKMFRLGLEIGLLILETILQPRLPRSVFIWRWPGSLRLIIKPSTWEVGRVKRGFPCLSAAAGSLAAWGCFGSCACG